MTDQEIGPDGIERRKYKRYRVFEPCRTTYNGKQYKGRIDKGRIESLSVGGAGIVLDMRLEIQPPKGTKIDLYLDRIGMLRTKIVRLYPGGIGVEFDMEQERDKRLIATLKRVIDEYDRRSRPMGG